MTKAKFVTENGQKTIPLHFNPSEYSITANTDRTTPAGNYLSSLKNEQLSMQLIFDTYTNYQGRWGQNLPILEREDVRTYTQPIANLAVGKDGSRQMVSFVWGSLNFKGVVISVSQKFTMFMDDGKPVRAVLDVVMQSADIDEIQPAAKNQTINWADNSWKDKVTIAKARQLLDKKF